MKKAIAEAKARVDQLLADRAAAQAEIDAIEVKRKPLLARITAIRARRAKVSVIANLAGRYLVTTLGAFYAETGYARELEAKPKAIHDALLAGKVKVGGGYGVSYTARGLAPRLRTPERATFAAFTKAKNARVRAERALSKAQDAEKAAIAAAFEAGGKFELEAIVGGLTDHAIASMRSDAVKVPYELTKRVASLDSWEGAPLRIAQEHLAFAKSGSSEPCPCADCATGRQEQAKAKAEAERRAALPRISFTCPNHGKRRGSFERRRQYLEAEGWVNDLPIVHCPMGDSFIHQPTRDADAAKAAKAKAKAEKAMTRVRPAFVEGEAMSFTCPGCGEFTEYAQVFTGDDDDLMVECANGDQYLAAGVAGRKIQRAEAA